MYRIQFYEAHFQNNLVLLILLLVLYFYLETDICVLCKEWPKPNRHIKKVDIQKASMDRLRCSLVQT